MKFLWLTDLHLNEADADTRRAFYRSLRAQLFDAAVITGDISVASLLRLHLQELARACSPRMIYFVLGNHDFYGSSFAEVEHSMVAVCRRHRNLQHLGNGEIVPLADGHALIGHRGWPDGRAGWGSRTVVPSRDHNRIGDFDGLSHAGVLAKMRELGETSAQYLRGVLPRALQRHRHVWVATHVPPFRQAAYFDGRPCAKTHLPHFANPSAGGLIVNIAQCRPEKRVTVLCGHTHCRTIKDITTNVRVYAGQARAGYPGMENTFYLN